MRGHSCAAKLQGGTHMNKGTTGWYVIGSGNWVVQAHEYILSFVVTRMSTLPCAVGQDPETLEQTECAGTPPGLIELVDLHLSRQDF